MLALVLVLVLVLELELALVLALVLVLACDGAPPLPGTQCPIWLLFRLTFTI